MIQANIKRGTCKNEIKYDIIELSTPPEKILLGLFGIIKLSWFITIFQLSH